MPLMECVTPTCDDERVVPGDTEYRVCGACLHRRPLRKIVLQDRKKRSKFDPDDCRSLRRELGLTQVQAAHKIGVPTYKLGRFERGEELPHSKIIAWLEEHGVTAT